MAHDALKGGLWSLMMVSLACGAVQFRFLVGAGMNSASHRMRSTLHLNRRVHLLGTRVDTGSEDRRRPCLSKQTEDSSKAFNGGKTVQYKAG